MTGIAQLALYSAVAGACIPAGALFAKFERIHPAWMEREFRHFVIAFGGGVLLAAVALVLLPTGTGNVHDPLTSVLYFLAGGVVFFGLERALGLRRRESPQFLAMLLDFIPESLALGGAFAIAAPAAPLLAILIGLQNLPEGFNAYRELKSIRGARPGRLLLMMSLLIPLGPALAISGWVFLSGYTHLLGAVMLFASGGILYLTFQDIAPQSRLRNHWFPPLGAVAGFALGLLGKALTDAS